MAEHPLLIWGRGKGLSLGEIARRAGLTPAYLSQVTTGTRGLGAGGARKLVSVTAGEVSYNSLFLWTGWPAVGVGSPAKAGTEGGAKGETLP